MTILLGRQYSGIVTILLVVQLLLASLFALPRADAFVSGGYHVWRTSATRQAEIGTQNSYSSDDDNSNPNVAAEQQPEILRQCGLERSVASATVVAVLQAMKQKGQAVTISQDLISGTFELVFSSSVAKIPLVGQWLDGYLPNREVVTFDFKEGLMTLEIETLPFLPTISVVGEQLVYDETSATLSYRVKNAESPTRWKILYAETSILAFESSKTGLNVIRRV